MTTTIKTTASELHGRCIDRLKDLAELRKDMMAREVVRRMEANAAAIADQHRRQANCSWFMRWLLESPIPPRDLKATEREVDLASLCWESCRTGRVQYLLALSNRFHSTEIWLSVEDNWELMTERQRLNLVKQAASYPLPPEAAATLHTELPPDGPAE